MKHICEKDVFVILSKGILRQLPDCVRCRCAVADYIFGDVARQNPENIPMIIMGMKMTIAELEAKQREKN